MCDFDEFEAIDKWAKDFGAKTLAIIGSEPVDEDGELSATFSLGAVVEEFAERYGVDVDEIGPTIVRRAAAECLMAMLRRSDYACVSVDGTVIVALTEPTHTGFELL